MVTVDGDCRVNKAARASCGIGGGEEKGERGRKEMGSHGDRLSKRLQTDN